MNKLMVPVLGMVGIASLASGCYSPKVSMINDYPTWSPAEVSLKDKATIKIVALDDGDFSRAVATSFRDAFAKSKQVTVVDGKADYWMIIGALTENRTDTAEQAAFTERTETVVVGAADGKPGLAHEELKARPQSSYTVAKGVSVAVYAADLLMPLHYFEIPVYAGAVAAQGGAKVPTQAELDAKLTQEVVRRVQDVFLTKDNAVKVSLPDEASAEMLAAMRTKDRVKAVEAAAKRAVPQKFDAFIKDVQGGKYADNQGELNRKLCDYYVLAIAREIGCLDVKALKELHAQQLAILQYATVDSLAKSCAEALKRLEYKLAKLGSK